MNKLHDKILELRGPTRKQKRELRKLAYKKMGGKTKKERFTNFFTNRTGYYSWKEMVVNYAIIIGIILLVVSGIVCAVNWKSFNIYTLSTNPLFQTLIVSFTVLCVALVVKRKTRKHRYKCFVNNGQTNDYVFWKDDITNPKNKIRRKTGFY